MPTRVTWPRVRAGAIALVIAIGVADGMLPSGSVRRTVLAPFARIGRDAGVHQRWKLFPGASPNRYRLEVEGHAATGWKLLYRIGDGEYDEYGDMLEYRRVRGAWNPRSHGVVGQYHPFAKWFASRVLADHPELTAVRLHMRRIRIEDGTVTELGGEPVFAVIHARPR